MLIDKRPTAITTVRKAPGGSEQEVSLALSGGHGMLVTASEFSVTEGRIRDAVNALTEQPGFQPMHFRLEDCTRPRDETNTSGSVNLSVGVRVYARSACADFVRLPHGHAASAGSRVPRPAAARARLRVGRRLLVPRG